MNVAFPVMAGAMVLLAGLFIAWPWLRKVEAGPTGQVVPRPRSMWLLGPAVVVMALGTYAWVGSPQTWLTPAVLTATATPPDVPHSAPADMQGQVGAAQIEAMVQRLAQRLQTQPDDAAGWRMLARSYETLRRFDDAALAYQRLIQLQPGDADVLVDYAVALGMSQGQALAGQPETLLEQALALAPAHPQALALAGSAAFERKDYARAIARWQVLLSHIPPEAEMRSSIQANIDKAQALQARGAARP